jgi:cation:H+ antiporter
MAASVGIWWFARNVEIARWEGLALVAGAVALLAMLYFRSRRARLTEQPTEDTDEELEDASRPLAVLLGGIAVASLGLYYGSEWFVDGARSIAINNGVSDHIIGLTVVAFGTSVPELVASGIAAWKREPELALGNLIGSNIFNIFLAAGISASIIPLPVDVQALEFDFWWMTGIALLVGLMMMHRAMIHRWKGAILLLIYLAYIGWIGGAVAAVAAI